MVSGTYFYFQWQPLERKHTKSKDNYTFGKVYIQVKFKDTYVQVYIQVKFKKEVYYCKKKKIIYLNGPIIWNDSQHI